MTKLCCNGSTANGVVVVHAPRCPVNRARGRREEYIRTMTQNLKLKQTEISDSVAQKQADAFLKANAKSKVIIGAVIGDGGQGAIYTLEDGSRHTLSAKACKLTGLPDWKI